MSAPPRFVSTLAFPCRLCMHVRVCFRNYTALFALVPWMGTGSCEAYVRVSSRRDISNRSDIDKTTTMADMSMAGRGVYQLRTRESATCFVLQQLAESYFPRAVSENKGGFVHVSSVTIQWDLR